MLAGACALWVAPTKRQGDPGKPGQSRLHFSTKLIAPPSEATDLVHTFYIIETDSARIDEPIPAYSAQLMVMIRGRVTFTFADGSSAPSSTVFFKAPQLRSADSVLEGPALQVGASLTHKAWQQLSNLPADTVHDQLIPAAAILTPAQLALLETAAEACRKGEISPEDLLPVMIDAIATAPFRLREDHSAVVDAILGWLVSGFDPSVRDLYASVDVSPRQVQRISRRFFGVAPAQVLKRFRALRAAMLLSQPGISEEVHDQLMATFFDQAHLTRDIRRYTGKTPTQLRKRSLVSSMFDPAAHGDAGALLRDAPESEDWQL
jgi:AraC-like DNA-binding protein